MTIRFKQRSVRLFVIWAGLSGCMVFVPAQMKGEVGGTSKNYSVLSPLDEYVVFDSYFNESRERTKKDHLDYFARTLDQRPEQIGYVISYGGIRDLLCESISNLRKVRKYLVSIKKIDGNRLVFVDGGFRKKGMTDFYIVPKDVRPPESSPAFRLNDFLKKS